MKKFNFDEYQKSVRIAQHATSMPLTRIRGSEVTDMQPVFP